MSEKIGQLKMHATHGKYYDTDCANTKGVFRIIQSIPLHKAEPFKRWLAKVGYDRVQEIENPELATQRTRALCRAKGYSDDWIEKRMRGITIHEELTDEWKKWDVKEKKEFEILTAAIAKAAFGVTPGARKKIKGLKREPLRDHMTDLELIFSLLGEAATTEITRVHNAQGFHQSKTAARKGGGVAGTARKNLEKETGKKVVSKENYLEEPKKVNFFRYL
ncbi:MAG TPA: BRO family protein [Dissulfurispiraceae bacterium]|nr:BRO family protein [Dissulfurispiraceae bacterium]